jgi:hypothetical protein
MYLLFSQKALAGAGLGMYLNYLKWESLINRMIWLWLPDWFLTPGRGTIFPLCYHVCTSSGGPEPLNQRVPTVCLQGVKQSQHEADHSAPYDTKGKNVRSLVVTLR